MKKYIIALIATCATACTPDMKQATMEPAIAADKINITQKGSTVQNIYEFSCELTGAQLVWDLGNGTKVNGNKAEGIYPFKGEYTITLTVLGQGGITTKSTLLTVAEDNYELVKDPLFVMVSGGIEAVDGKTWVMDSTAKGHMGCGPSDTWVSEWWNAAPMEKKGLGLYDDEITFKLKGAKFIYNNNGDSFVNGAAIVQAKARGASTISLDGDAVMAYMPQSSDWSWSITTEGGKNYINLPAGQGFAIYWTPEAHKYEILSINDDEMYLRTQLEGISWYLKLLRKGVDRPVEAPKLKPYKETEINITFDNAPQPSSVDWNYGESKGFSIVSNMPVGINKSSKIGMYERGENMWCSLTFQLPVNLDLTNRNVFRIKAFYPSSNSYNEKGLSYGWSESEDDIYALTHLDKTITMRLQNAEISEPWTDQADVTVKVEKFDQWVEYEFDFSAFKNIDRFDQILLQFGGEPKTVDGAFFFDDLILK